MPPAEPEKRPPARFAAVTLCSTERAYRVEADGQGQFEFTEVPAGTYDVVAFTPGLALATISSLNVPDKELPSSLTVLVPGSSKNSPCWVNSKDAGTPFKFEVNYQMPEAGRTAPIIRGEAGRWVLKHSNSPVVVKPLTQAQISLFRVGEKTAIMSTTSDQSGHFEFHPEPGVYELKMSHKGYHDVHVPAFLVPRENVTLIPISSGETGMVVTTL